MGEADQEAARADQEAARADQEAIRAASPVADEHRSSHSTTSEEPPTTGLGRGKNPFEKTRVFSNGFYGFFQNYFEKTRDPWVFSKI